MIIGNKTITTRYILPFLFENKNIFNDEHSFINAYIEDINRPYIENSIFVLFKYNSNVYDKINKEMESNPYYYDKHDIFVDNEYYNEFIFVIPRDKRDTIDCIKKGFSNALSQENKEHIINFWKDNSLSYLKDLINAPKDITQIKTLKERNEIVGIEDCPTDIAEHIVQYYFND